MSTLNLPIPEAIEDKQGTTDEAAATTINLSNYWSQKPTNTHFVKFKFSQQSRSNRQ